MRVNGGCHCGLITYEADVDPQRVLICHCSDCQILSGTAYRTLVAVPEENFRLLSGSPRIYLKTADSGALREQAFCENCGSPMYATSAGDPPRVLGIRLGTVKQRAQLKPMRQIWCQSAQPWVNLLGEITKFERS